MNRALLVAEYSLLLQEHKTNNSPFSTVNRTPVDPSLPPEEKLTDCIAILGSINGWVPKDKEYVSICSISLHRKKSVPPHYY